MATSRSIEPDDADGAVGRAAPERAWPDPDTEAMHHLLDGIVSDHMDANRREVLRARNIADAVRAARSRPHVYTTAHGKTGVSLADRAVVFDLSLRLQLSETAIRDLARAASDAQVHLPDLWSRAEEGYAPLALVTSTLAGACRLVAAEGASEQERDAAAAALRELDTAAAEWVLHCTPGAFRSRVARLVDRLDARSMARRHAVALRDRRVVVEDAGDGMSWLQALLPTTAAVAITRRLTSTAKHLAKRRTETRTRDQLRADLLAAWARGDRTPTAVKTSVFVTVPVGVLAGQAADDEGRCTACGGSGRPEQPMLVGHGPIDDHTATQLFLDATAFRRVITDPVHSVVVDMDRRSRHATRAQREWLVLQHGTCARDGCTRLAMDSDIDHEREWVRGGKTDLGSLRPLCPPDHNRRHRTKFAFRSRTDRTVQVVTPTGFASTAPPPF